MGRGNIALAVMYSSTAEHQLQHLRQYPLST
jgi:hypothetical protein